MSLTERLVSRYRIIQWWGDYVTDSILWNLTGQEGKNRGKRVSFPSIVKTRMDTSTLAPIDLACLTRFRLVTLWREHYPRESDGSIGVRQSVVFIAYDQNTKLCNLTGQHSTPQECVRDYTIKSDTSMPAEGTGKGRDRILAYRMESDTSNGTHFVRLLTNLRAQPKRSPNFSLPRRV